MTSIHSEIGQRLRQLRQRRGLTDWQVAAALGMAIVDYRLIELGQRRMGAADLMAFVRSVDCRIADVFEGIGAGKRKADATTPAEETVAQILEFTSRRRR